jgi:hypothetical protein
MRISRHLRCTAATLQVGVILTAKLLEPSPNFAFRHLRCSLPEQAEAVLCNAGGTGFEQTLPEL